MVAVPGERPETTPKKEIAATVVLLLLHVPANTFVNVVDVPWQIDVSPDMGVTGLTYMMVLTEQLPRV